MIFVKWLWASRRRQFLSVALVGSKIMASAVLFERHPFERTAHDADQPFQRIPISHSDRSRSGWRIKDLKVGFGMEYMPCGSFQANAVFFAIGVLTYNLYLGFRSDALGSGWERSQVRTVRWRLFQTAGKIVRHGRQIFLQIGTAMLDMFAAIRERCVRIMREGGAIPETS